MISKKRDVADKKLETAQNSGGAKNKQEGK